MIINLDLNLCSNEKWNSDDVIEDGILLIHTVPTHSTENEFFFKAFMWIAPKTNNE